MKDVGCVYNTQIWGITPEMRFHYCLFCFAYIFAFLCNYLFNLEELVYHTLLNEQRKLHNILLHFLFCENKNQNSRTKDCTKIISVV